MSPGANYESDPVLVLGAGPAGLTAALLLARRGRQVTVLEADSAVGGLAKTVERNGYRFDLGGHRFFTKSEEVLALWREVMSEDLLLRPRLSRIYWRGRFIGYPLQVGDVIRRVGPTEVARSGASYLASRLRPSGSVETFEDWVTDRFGRRLFELFFRSYTEKVWGVPTSEIRAEWAAQRIRGFSLGRAFKAAVFGRDGGEHTLTQEFLYPRLGPGQMWEAMAAELAELGGEIRLDSPVTGMRLEEGRIAEIDCNGEGFRPEAVVSSLPLRTLAAIVDQAPESVRDHASGLRYRDFMTVALVIEGADPFPDNWIYIHEPEVNVGRIQNFRSWSPDMVPEPDRCCLGLEYFCFEGDELWRRDDDDLIAMAGAELDRLGLAGAEQVARGHVVRVPKAYPIYDSEYEKRVEAIREWLDGIGNIEQIGRNGLHRYNNSDHSMLTAMRAVENLCDGAGHDVWAVNADDAYHEEEAEQPYRRAPLTPALGMPLSEEARPSQETV